MSAQKGKDLLLKIDATDTGNYVTVAGLRARRLSLNARSIDITDAESAGRWRELLDGAGTRAAALSGGGIFKDQVSDETVRETFFNGSVRDWEVIVPDFGTFRGPFQITALEYSGQHDGEVTFELAMESAGELAFEVAQ